MEQTSYVKRMPSNSLPVWKGALLRTLDIELTERCNNNCLHCNINLPRHSESRLRESTTEDVQDLIREAAALGCLSVRFTGGEPLLREDFAEIYVFARRTGLRVLLFTNATLITPNLADLFERIPPLEKIDVSVYGLKTDSYDAVSRVSGSRNAAFRGLELLIQKKIPFAVKSPVLPPNKGELAEFGRWAASLPNPEQRLSFITSFSLRTRRDSEFRDREIRGIRLTPKEQFNIQAGDRKRYLAETLALLSESGGPPGTGLFPCGAGRARASVDSYGTIQPCLLLRHPNTVVPPGKGALREALTQHFPELRKTCATNPEYIRRCARCFLSGFCDQCPAQSWSEHGTLDTPVEHCCEAAHYGAREIGLLAVGEFAWEVRDWKRRLEQITKGGRIHDSQS